MKRREGGQNKNEQSICDLWDNIRQPNSYEFGVEGKSVEEVDRKKFEKQWLKHFPKCMKSYKPTDPRSPNPSRINIKKMIPRNIMKLLN